MVIVGQGLYMQKSVDFFSCSRYCEIEKALKQRTNKPIMIIANTIKGNGIPTMENNPAWHHAAPKMNEVENLLGGI